MSNNVFKGNYDLNCFEIKFNKYKVSTCYYEKPFKVSNGVKALICDNVELTNPNTHGYNINFSPIKTNIVPARTPVWLKSDEAKTYRFWFDETNTDKAQEPNYLYGTSKDIDIFSTFPENKYDVFCLGLNNKTGEVGWWYPAGNAPLPAHKALLLIPK